MTVPLLPVLEPVPALGLVLPSTNGTAAGAEGGDSTGEGYAAAGVLNWGGCATATTGMAADVPADADLNDGSQGGSTSSKVCGGASRGPNSGTHAIS